jgi:putative addiction module component (TIGR02574 family)
MTTAESILVAALDLPDPDRAKLALRLVESLDGPADEDVEVAWATEIRRRVMDLREGKSTTLSADEVKGRVHARLAKRRA